MAADNHHSTSRREFKHLSLAERGAIKALLREGRGVRYIARSIGRSASTVSREIHRGTTTQLNSDLTTREEYFPETGQAVHDDRRAHNGFHRKIAYAGRFLEFAEQAILEMHLSPDAIVGACRIDPAWEGEVILCARTLYSYISEGLLRVSNADLPLKSRRKKRGHPRPHKRQLGRSIDERPAEVGERQELGHWEIDTVVGKISDSRVLLTLTERMTRYEFIFPIEGRKSASVGDAIAALRARLGDSFGNWFKSVTADNGTEFARLSDAFGNDIPVYFAHPYSAWERGTNERHNGLIRRFLPKGKSLDGVTQDTVRRIQDWLNHLPRKILGYKTPQEKLREELSSVA